MAPACFIDIGPLARGDYMARATVYGITSGVAADLCNGPQTITTLAIEKASGPQARLTAVEFYSQSRDHHFVTADPAEISALDAGTQPGWSRTGKSFAVFVAGQSGGVGTPVCRFYGAPGAGLDSHFYTANAFEVRMPNAQAQCTSGFVPIYRLWNRRADSNHRFTTDLSVVVQMRKKGWIVESAIGEGAAMCSPP